MGPQRTHQLATVTTTTMAREEAEEDEDEDEAVATGAPPLDLVESLDVQHHQYRRPPTMLPLGYKRSSIVTSPLTSRQKTAPELTAPRTTKPKSR
jgi:hypothetical protein